MRRRSSYAETDDTTERTPTPRSIARLTSGWAHGVPREGSVADARFFRAITDGEGRDLRIYEIGDDGAQARVAVSVDGDAYVDFGTRSPRDPPPSSIAHVHAPEAYFVRITGLDDLGLDPASISMPSRRCVERPARQDFSRPQLRRMWPVRRSDRGVYVHFPYCVRKCPYCDFNSHAIAHDDARYANALLGESRIVEALSTFRRSARFTSEVEHRASFEPHERARVRGLRARFGLAERCEVTLEANPGTIAELDDFPRWVDIGINRFSIGAQSFVDEELRFLGRIHDGARCPPCAAHAPPAQPSRSISSTRCPTRKSMR